MLDAKDSASTRPYLIRALFEWCTDNGFTPYVAVMVDDSVRVPMEYVKDGEIVLNISYDATSALKLGNDTIEFKARFAGAAREIMVPVHRVIAIYARENGQGMAFPVGQAGVSANESNGNNKAAGPGSAKGPGTPPLLTAVKPAPVDPASNVVQLGPQPGDGGPAPATDGPKAGSAKPGGDDPDSPPPASPGGRPALKRIK